MSATKTKQYHEPFIPTSLGTSAASPAPRSEELLERIALRLDRIETRMVLLDPIIEQLPALFAMGVDTFDDLAALSAERGYDIDGMLKAAFELVPRIYNLLSSPEFYSLMDSGMLSPTTLNVLGRFAEALNTANKAPGGEGGFLYMMRSTRDKRVRRALHFAMQVMGEFGARLDVDVPTALNDSKTPKTLSAPRNRS